MGHCCTHNMHHHNSLVESLSSLICDIEVLVLKIFDKPFLIRSGKSYCLQVFRNRNISANKRIKNKIHSLWRISGSAPVSHMHACIFYEKSWRNLNALTLSHTTVKKSVSGNEYYYWIIKQQRINAPLLKPLFGAGMYAGG